MRRIWAIALNTGLVVFSLGLFFLVLEFATFTKLATYVPIKLHRHLGDMGALAQPSKKVSSRKIIL